MIPKFNTIRILLLSLPAIATILTGSLFGAEAKVFFATKRTIDFKNGTFVNNVNISENRNYGIYTANVLNHSIIPVVHSESDIRSIEKSASYQSWVNSMRKTYPSSHRVFVYVHGFRNSFKDGLQRTAILSEKMNSTVPVVYSWPASKLESGNFFDNLKLTLLNYNNSIEVEDASSRDFAQFLKALSRSFGGPQNVSIVAHSFGNSITLKALTDEARSLKFRNIVMVAPDVPRWKFDRSRSLLEGNTKRLSLYVAEDDLVLSASTIRDTSRWTKGSLGNQRIGTLFNTPGKTDVIDSSRMGLSLGGHSYHVTSRAVRDDIVELIDKDRSADQRTAYLKKMRIKETKDSWFTFKKKSGDKAAIKRDAVKRAKQPFANAFMDLLTN